jgi:hypothetical protein
VDRPLLPRLWPRGEPSVIWFDADLGTELVLAADFTAFLQGLTAVGDFT